MTLLGRSLAIMPSGTIDLEEDFASGYGGQKSCEILETEGKCKWYRPL